jgi:hypothetical protein
VRILRVAAIAGNALLLVVALGGFFAPDPTAAWVVVALSILGVCGTSVVSLVSRAGDNGGVLVFIVPALLNLVAIELLRRARAALAH